MTIKDFHKRYLRAIVHPEMMLLPTKQKKRELQPFIFEIADEYLILPSLQFTTAWSPSNSVAGYDSSAYYINKLQQPKYKHLKEEGFIDNGSTYSYLSINTQWSYNICYAQTPFYIDGEKEIPITKDTHPELFTDFWPCHDIANGKLSEQLISDSLEPPRIELDDGTVLTYEWTYYTLNFYTDPNTNLKYYVRLRTNAKPLFDALKDNDGNDIRHPVFGANVYHIFTTEGSHEIKLYGTWPGFSCPYNTTAILQWGNVGMLTLYNIIKPLMRYTNSQYYIRDSETNTTKWYYSYQETPSKYYLRYIAEPSGLDRLLSFNFQMTNWDLKFVSEQAITQFFHLSQYIGDSIVSIGNLFYAIFVCDSTDNIPEIMVTYENDFLSNKPYLVNINYILSIHFRTLKYTVYSYSDSSNRFGETMQYQTVADIIPLHDITIGNGFLSNNLRLFTTSTLFEFKVHQVGNDIRHSHIAIGNDFMRNTGLFDILGLYSGLFMGGHIITVGNNCFADCRRLRQLNTVFYGQTELQQIGDGLFSGCPNITYINRPFDNCKILKQIPDKLFYDLVFSMNNYDRDYIYFDPLFNKSLDVAEEYNPDIHVTKIGQNMFNSSFLSSCKMYIGTTFANYYSTSRENADGSRTTIRLPWFSGYAPDFWNYPDNIGFDNSYGGDYNLHTITDTYINGKYGSLCRRYYGYFGYPYALLSESGGVDTYTRWDNQDDIPFPKGIEMPPATGNGYDPAAAEAAMDQLWLYYPS